MVKGHDWEGVPHVFAPLMGSEVLEAVPRKFGLPFPSTLLAMIVLSYPAAAEMFSVRFWACEPGHVQRSTKTDPELTFNSLRFVELRSYGKLKLVRSGEG